MRQIFNNAPFWYKKMLMCAPFCQKMMHLVIWDWCIVGFVPQMYYLVQEKSSKRRRHRLFLWPFRCLPLHHMDDYLITITDSTDGYWYQFPKLFAVWVHDISDELPPPFHYSAILVRIRMTYGPGHGLLADITGSLLGSVSIYNQKYSLGCFRENSCIIAYKQYIWKRSWNTYHLFRGQWFDLIITIHTTVTNWACFCMLSNWMAKLSFPLLLGYCCVGT